MPKNFNFNPSDLGVSIWALINRLPIEEQMRIMFATMYAIICEALRENPDLDWESMFMHEASLVYNAVNSKQEKNDEV